MEIRKPREYQTLRLFGTLGFMTLLLVLLMKVVLFAPHSEDKTRMPTQQIENQSALKNSDK
jgi:hypothetical protein